LFRRISPPKLPEANNLQQEHCMINRRDFLGLGVSAGASLALGPDLLRGLQRPGGALLQKAIPATGERLPAVGLSFSNHPGCADHAALTEVLKTFYDKGGRVYDVSHVNPSSEDFHIAAANDLGINTRLFWSTRGTPPSAGAPQPGAQVVHDHIDSLLARTKRSKIDLAMLPAAGDPSHRAALKEEKKAGRVRYIGVQTIVAAFRPEQVEAIMRDEQIDFVGVDYDIGSRRVEEVILPLAVERNIAVMAFFPYGNAGGISCAGGTSLFSRVANTPLPEWASEFDATTWAQFFTKYVISHPAVTVARVGTTKPKHMLDNIGGGFGRLPDEATRKRMAAFIDALPAAAPVKPPAPQNTQNSKAPPGIVLPVAVLDRYVGDYETAGGSKLNFRRYGTTLVGKAGPNPDIVMYPYSETRFLLGSNFLEFQRDSAGRVTGLIYEQDSQKISAKRIQ
jgi:aryl-alcohol dehydrogenase-like predicted oxidoreductase